MLLAHGSENLANVQKKEVAFYLGKALVLKSTSSIIAGCRVPTLGLGFY